MCVFIVHDLRRSVRRASWLTEPRLALVAQYLSRAALTSDQGMRLMVAP